MIKVIELERLWSYRIYLHAVWVLLYALLFLLSTRAFCAAVVPSSAQEIAHYQSQVADAQAWQSAVGIALRCLSERDTQLAARRESDEIKIGELLRRDEDLKSEVASDEQAIQSANEELLDQQRQRDEQSRRLQRLMAIRDAQQRELAQCKAHSWLPDFACDFGSSIAHWVGEYEETEDRIRALSHQIQRFNDAADEARARLNVSQGHLDQVRGELNTLSTQAHSTEVEISAIKKELSTLRLHEQAHQLIMDEFADILSQAIEIHTEDQKKRTALHLQAISSRLDETKTQIAAAIARARASLPMESANCIER